MKINYPINGTEEEIKEVEKIYKDYPELPYISPERNLRKWFRDLDLTSETRVPLRNMQRTEEGLLPGDIILIWRISLGTFTNESVMPKYFEYDYGINAHQSLKDLIEHGYVVQESPYESMDHVTATLLKSLLKMKNVKGYSKLNKTGLVEEIKKHYSNKELDEHFDVRGMRLTDSGKKALENNQFVIDKHPTKPGY
ncbi:MAG: hypothetical protein ACTHVZ_08200 [Ruoffia tabacinasalis]